MAFKISALLLAYAFVFTVWNIEKAGSPVPASRLFLF